MTKPRLTRPKRSSFGGKNGIWWTAKGLMPRSSEDGTTATEEVPLSASNNSGGGGGSGSGSGSSGSQKRSHSSSTTTGTTAQVIGWDDDLCRPIYSIVSDGCLEDSSKDDDGDGDALNNNDDDGDDDDDPSLERRRKRMKQKKKQKKEEKIQILQKVSVVPAKRTATFGDRPRRSLALCLLDAGVGDICWSSPEQQQQQQQQHKHKRQNKTEDLGLLSSPDTPLAGTSSPAFPSSPRRISLDPAEDDTSNGSGRGAEVSSSTSPTTTTSSTSTSTNARGGGQDGEEEEDGLLAHLDFVASSPEKKTAAAAAASKKGKDAELPTPLRKAKEYFANLDATHKLTICNTNDNNNNNISNNSLEDDDNHDEDHNNNNSHNNNRSSRVIRTSHKANLSSPGLTKEYGDYSEATRGLGVSPLPIREYAKSRRDFFRKGELFNGFLDD
jgi:hypothetical protein